jgi:histidinol dehydrogenase
MILTYDEALNRAENKEWFKQFYKREEIISDEDVKEINALVAKTGEKALNDYFETNDDIFLQKEYKDDLIEYLLDVINGVAEL